MTRRTFDNRVLPDVDLRSPLRRLSRRGGVLSDARRRTGKEHPAVVASAPDLLGQVTVVIRGREARASTVGVSTRGVLPGDRVMVAKRGGRWVITTTLTPHGPSDVATADASAISYDGSNHTNAINTLITRYRDLAAAYNTLHARLQSEQIVKEP